MSDFSANAAPWEGAAADSERPEPVAGDFASGEFAEGGNTPAEAVLPEAGSSPDAPIPPEKVPLVNEIAVEFMGFWNRLVSQTNWEKGKVIFTWRTRLIEAGLPRGIYSDEAIAQRIGGISSQHVGRLRRVYEKFGRQDIFPRGERYKNLYWSHFQAALDWDDAFRWLDKASAEGLSVAQMRIARWEEYGAPADKKPKDSDIVASEPDEDVNPRNDSDAEQLDSHPIALSEDKEKNSEPAAGDSKSAEDEKPDAASLLQQKGSDEPWNSPAGNTTGILRAMDGFPALPDDLAQPIKALKESILNHRVSGWSEVSQDDLLVWIGALRGLILSQE